MKNVTVVLDSMAGSCGKGKFIGYLAKKDNIDLAINNFMSNAGHTWVDNDGKKVMTQHLPTSLVNESTALVIGPGSAITPRILFDEILRFKSMIGNRSIIVNPRAVVIKPSHCDTEKRVLRSGSTFKGCGAAQADKLMRQAQLFGDWYKGWCENPECYIGMCDDYYQDHVTFIKNHIVIMDTMEYVNNAIDDNHSVMIEGSQGCDLDINYGLDYPNTTSRQCHVGQLVADCGISPMLVTDIIMIMRPYPIRISNETNLMEGDSRCSRPLVTSSGDYSGSEEISWDVIKERCGAPADMEFGEFTTVTKKLRRVFEMNWERLKYTSTLNRPTQIALNFVQYIDWRAYKCKEYSELPNTVKKFIAKVESITHASVTLIGTGPNDEDIIDLRRY